MESKANTIDLGTMKAFTAKFPHVSVKEPKWAEANATEEFRRMAIGDIVLFPMERFNYNTIRNVPYTGLAIETVNGWTWSSKLDRANKSIAVIRIA